MKNIFSKLLSAAVIAGMGFGMTSCDLEFSPKGYYTEKNFWTERDQYIGFITALQNQFRANYPTQVLFSAGELRAGSLWLGALPDGSGSADEKIIQNMYTQSDAQFSTFGGWYGFIANLNELLWQIDNQDGILDENTADGIRAIAYGWRAYSFFQMYRMYGGLPLRLEPDVMHGDYVPENLYMARSTAEETLAQIKKDIAASLECFGKSTYAFNVGPAVYSWTKGATELLAGQVYLWSAKVETGDHKPTAASADADVATAKTYFNNVLTNYGYELQKDFYNIWLTPANKESIFSVCYSSLADKTYYGSQTNFNWSRVTGAAGDAFWSTWDDDGWGKLTDGTANRFGRWATKDADGKVTQRNSKVWDHFSLGVQRYMFKNALYFQFDAQDHRGDAFYPVYRLTDAQRDLGIKLLDDFDPKKYEIAGTFVIKFRYSEVEGSQYYVCRVDMPLLRLPDAILGMAECCNYQGDNAGVETYINKLRERAYAENWDAATYGYHAGTFAENESAILREVDKEFYLEGRRWWALRQLTTVKNGKQTDHLVFQPQGCVGYGLDPAVNKWMTENNNEAIQTATAVLQTNWEYKLLWPLNSSLLGADPLLVQNPGYEADDEE